MTLHRIRQYASLLLLLASTALVIIVTVYAVKVARRLDSTLAQIQGAAAQSKMLVTEARQVVKYEKAEFEDGDYRVRLKQSLDLANHLLAQINQDTVPRINASVDQLTEVGRQAAMLTADSNRSINVQLVPQLTQTIQDTDEAIRRASDQLNTALGQLTPEAAKVLQNLAKSSTDLDAILNDPAIKASLQEISASTTAIHESAENLKVSSQSVSKALEQFPDIAADIRAYTKAQSKATKYVIAARVISALIPIVNAFPR